MFIRDTHSLIRTPSWRLIQVCARVDEDLLPGAHQPSGFIRPFDIRHGPRQGITLELERAIGILRRAEPSLELPLGLIGRVLNVEVKLRRLGVEDDLAVDDVELPSGGVVLEESGLVRGSSGRGAALEVLVEVGSGNGSDPVPAWFQDGRVRVGRNGCGGGSARGRIEDR